MTHQLLQADGNSTQAAKPVIETEPNSRAIEGSVAVANPSMKHSDLVLSESSQIATEPNIIVFGESGSGKSSLVNMILGEEHISVSSQAMGCTFDSRGYSTNIGGHTFTIWDTAGLNEGDCGAVTASSALDKLKNLATTIRGDASLLVYCIRASRFRDIWKFNYDIFYEIIFDRQVPIVAVFTGLENEENMDDWFTENQMTLAERGLVFSGHACVTLSKGRFLPAEGVHMFEEEYRSSAESVKTLLLQRLLLDEPRPKHDMSSFLAGVPDRLKQYIAHYAKRSERLSPARTRSSEERCEPSATATGRNTLSGGSPPLLLRLFRFLQCLVEAVER
ncbi:P-loop containing nucleoside triphosphate hydrolase protein [Cyathus striatus]|nr:P-loop containing nucleoside triphosphate hydrolase protein [Cyathus striatus]